MTRCSPRSSMCWSGRLRPVGRLQHTSTDAEGGHPHGERAERMPDVLPSWGPRSQTSRITRRHIKGQSVASGTV
jgi:hypothetical protein